VILGEFVLERELGQGAFGIVYLVRSKTTDSLFAVKRLKTSRQEHRRLLLAELTAWTELPEHPNLTACRFLRTVGNDIVIFADFAEGGSLADWIAARRYSLEQALDLAIQSAWGLHVLHELGFVHQDIKPGNVLIAGDGAVRISDFGLLPSRWVEDSSPMRCDDGPTARAYYCGSTPAYCSPEQAQAAMFIRRGLAAEPRCWVTGKTDIWSWGLMILEMFTGRRIWGHGTEAMTALDGYLSNPPADAPIAKMPPEMADVLRNCFADSAADRWPPEEIVRRLKAIHEDCLGQPFRRPLAPACGPAGHVLDIRRRTLADGGVWESPRAWLDAALRHRGLKHLMPAAPSRSRPAGNASRMVADLSAFEEGYDKLKQLLEAGHQEVRPVLAGLCLQKAMVHCKADDFAGALDLYEYVIDLTDELVCRLGHCELTGLLANACMNQGVTLSSQGNEAAAIVSYDRAIRTCRTAQTPGDALGVAACLAKSLLNKGNSLLRLGRYAQAVRLFGQAARWADQLRNYIPPDQLGLLLCKAYMNQATAAHFLGRDARAIEMYDQAIQVAGSVRRGDRGRWNLALELSNACRNKATLLQRRGQVAEAVTLYGQAIELLKRLSDRQPELANDLSAAYVSKANALAAQDRHAQAIRMYDRAIAVMERVIRRGGQSSLARDLSRALCNKGIVLKDVRRYDQALGCYRQAEDILGRVSMRLGRKHVANDLARLALNRANIYKVTDNCAKAIPLYDRAIRLIRNGLEKDSVPSRQEMAKAMANKASACKAVGDPKAAIRSLDAAIALLQGKGMGTVPAVRRELRDLRKTRVQAVGRVL
jgi:tetratricopeptide (TPR) repeat protein